MHNLFVKFAHTISHAVGTSWAFIIAFSLVLSWAISGPVFHFSETWQLFINTGTTIVTFLMVFLIQNQQNRDSQAMELKLDELIRASKASRDTLINIEEMSDEELEKLQGEFRMLKEKRDRKNRK